MAHLLSIPVSHRLHGGLLHHADLLAGHVKDPRHPLPIRADHLKYLCGVCPRVREHIPGDGGFFEPLIYSVFT